MIAIKENQISVKSILAEMRLLMTDRFSVALIFVVPILSFLCFAGIYSQRVIRDLPLIVVDHDNSALSRQLRRAFDATPSMNLIEAVNDETPVIEYFKRSDVAAVLVIPEKFERDIRAGQQPTLTFYKNSANIIVSNVLYSDAQTTAKMVNAAIGIQKLGAKGIPPQQALHYISPITIQNSPLYNPNYNYEQFMPIGTYLALLQMMFLVASVVHIYKLKESERGFTFRTGLISFICQASLHGLSFFLIIFGIYEAFGVDLWGSAVSLLLLTFIFFVFLYLLSVIIGLQKEGLSKALAIIVFYATPGFIFSGYTFPLRGMPGVFSVGQFFPFSVYLSSFIKCAYMHAPAEALSGEIRYAFIAGCILLVLLCFVILLREQKKAGVAA
jgi:ABC-2 type transport system permease protein